MGFDLKQSQSIMGMKMENTIKQEMIESRGVDAVDSEGKVTVKLKTVRRKMNAEFGAAGKFEFDSKSTERDAGSAIGGALTPLLERLTGSEDELIRTPLRHVAEVKGDTELGA